jgi:hypothetical protein
MTMRHRLSSGLAILVLGSAYSIGCTLVLGLDDLKGTGTTTEGSGAGSSVSSTSSSTGAGGTGAGGTGAGGLDGGDDADSGGPQPGDVLSAERYGDVEDQQVRDVAVDAAGNVYVVGSFRGELEFGCQKMWNAGAIQAGYLAKFDSSGKCVDALLFNSSTDVACTAVTVDTNGNIAVAGTFTGTFNIPGGAQLSAMSQDAFVASYGSNFLRRWDKQIGGAGDEIVNRIAVDQDGNVFAVGAYTGSFTVPGYSFPNSGARNGFLVRFDDATSGTPKARQFASPADGDDAFGVAVGPNGNVAVVGTFTGPLDFGDGSPLTPDGPADAFVAIYPNDVTSQLNKAQKFGDMMVQTARAVAYGTNGVLYVAGTFNGTIDFESNPLSNPAGGADAFLARFDSDLLVNATAIRLSADGASNVEVAGLALDPKNDDVFIAGALRGNAMLLGTSAKGDATNNSVYVARVSSSLQQLGWFKVSGANDAQVASRVVFSPSVPSALVAGHFQGNMNLGGGVDLSSIGGNDIFVVSFVP